MSQKNYIMFVYIYYIMLSLVIIDKLNSISQWKDFWNSYYKKTNDYSVGPAITLTTDEKINSKNIQKSIDLFLLNATF